MEENNIYAEPVDYELSSSIALYLFNHKTVRRTPITEGFIIGKVAIYCESNCKTFNQELAEDVLIILKDLLIKNRRKNLPPTKIQNQRWIE